MRLAMVAADYTPGEAESVAARHGGVAAARPHRAAPGPARFADGGEGESRGSSPSGCSIRSAASASTAFRRATPQASPLIAYGAAWLRCHYPDVFTCALLNAQPMGFYTPATIVDDAVRHGVEVRPVDVTASEWDCTLEEAADAPAAPPRPDLQAGKTSRRAPLRRADGLPLREGLLREARLRTARTRARAARPFTSMADIARRARLDEAALRRLAEAGAFAPFEKSAPCGALGGARTGCHARRPPLQVASSEVTAGVRFAQRVRNDRLGLRRERPQHRRPHPLAPVARQARRAATARGLHRRRDA